MAPEIQQFRYFFDKELGTECEWTLASSRTELRCMPSRRVELYFLDTNCSEAIASSNGWDTRPHSAPGDLNQRGRLEPGDFVSAETNLKRYCGAGLPEPREVYRVGETIPADAVQSLRARPIFRRTEAGCTQVRDPFFRPQTSVHRLQPESETQFVAGHVSRIDVDTLAIQRVRGTDGSEKTVGVTGPDGVYCALLAEGQCVPGRLIDEAISMRDQFFDKKCTGGILFGDALGPVCPPKFAVVRPWWSGIFAIRPLTPTGDATTYACDGRTFPLMGQTNGYLLGPDISAELPRGRVFRHGTGPIYMDQVVAVQPLRPLSLERGRALSLADGSSCDVTPAADGSLRCVPDWLNATFPSNVFYADSECLIPVYGSYAERDVSELIIRNAPVRNGAFTREDNSRLTTLWSAKNHEGPLYSFSSDKPTSDQPCKLVEKREDINWGGFVPPFLVRDKPLPFSVFPEVEATTL